MNSYAIYDGEKIINVVVADTIDDVVIDFGLEVIECNDGVPWIDWTKVDEEWRPPQPYPSWYWENGEWNPPTPRPNDNRYIWEWNENDLSWTRFSLPQPFPSWTIDNDGVWQPPIPEPESDGVHVYAWDEDSQSWELIPD